MISSNKQVGMPSSSAPKIVSVISKLTKWIVNIIVPIYQYLIVFWCRDINFFLQNAEMDILILLKANYNLFFYSKSMIKHKLWTSPHIPHHCTQHQLITTGSSDLALYFGSQLPGANMRGLYPAQWDLALRITFRLALSENQILYVR